MKVANENLLMMSSTHSPIGKYSKHLVGKEKMQKMVNQTNVLKTEQLISTLFLKQFCQMTPNLNMNGLSQFSMCYVAIKIAKRKGRAAHLLHIYH